MAFVVATVVVALGLRVLLMASGPDVDSDTYGHMIIGRTLSGHWLDARHHWVWLPGWHVVIALVTKTGSGVQAMRGISAVASALSSALLWALLRTCDKRTPVPFLAAFALLLFPLWSEHGQSAEPEALFTFLLLGVAHAMATGRLIVASVLLALMCTLRYEAWVLVPLACVADLRLARTALRPSLRRMATIGVLPVLTIASWCVARRATDGRWFYFLVENTSFVSAALPFIPSTKDPPSIVGYAWALPFRQIGYIWGFAGAGIFFLRRLPRAFVVLSLGLLAFVTYGWLRGAHLGLERHAYAALPFFATVLARGLFETLRRLTRIVLFPRANAHTCGHVALLLLVPFYGTVLYTHTIPILRHTMSVQRNAYVEERNLGKRLREMDPSRVFCSLPRVEVFSGLAPDRFLRWSPKDVRLANVEDAAKVHGAPVAVVVDDEQVGDLMDLASHLAQEGSFGRLRLLSYPVR